MKSLLASSKTPTKTPRMSQTTPTNAMSSAVNNLSMSAAAAQLLRQQQQEDGRRFAPSMRSAPTTPGMANRYANRAAAMQMIAGKEGKVTAAQAYLASELEKLNSMSADVQDMAQQVGRAEAGEGDVADEDEDAQDVADEDEDAELERYLQSRGMGGRQIAPSPPEEDGQEGGDSAEALLAKIQGMRNLLDGMTKGNISPEDAAQMAATLRGMGGSEATPRQAAMPAPIKQQTTATASSPFDGNQDELIEGMSREMGGDKQLLAELAADPKLKGYMDSLSALDAEKKSMESQLQEAQDQQSEMLNKLESMRAMLGQFNQMAGRAN